jgi:hypothetical protein
MISQYFTRRILTFLLSTQQRQSDMNGRDELSDIIHNCRVGLQHGSGSAGASDLRFAV